MAEAAAESQRLEEAWTELFGSFRRAKHELDTQAALVESEAARVMTHAREHEYETEGAHDAAAAAAAAAAAHAASDPPPPHFSASTRRGGGGEEWLDAFATSTRSNVGASNDHLERWLRDMGMRDREERVEQE